MSIPPGTGVGLSLSPVFGVGFFELGDGKGEIHARAIGKTQPVVEAFKSIPTGGNTLPELHISSPIFNSVKVSLKSGGPRNSTITEGAELRFNRESDSIQFGVKDVVIIDKGREKGRLVRFRGREINLGHGVEG